MQPVAKFCSPEDQDIVRLYTSAYFAHPELLLMTLLASDDCGKRVFAVDFVNQQIWGGGDSGICLPRKFVPLALNFWAEMLAEHIDWGQRPCRSRR